MGQCFGKPPTAAKRPPSSSSKQQQHDINKPTTPDGPSGFTFTKGSSMALPDQADKLQLSPAEAHAVAEMNDILNDPTLFDHHDEEDLDNPVYARVDRSYRVGGPIAYAPEMTANLGFLLREEEGDGGVQVTFAYRSYAGKSDARNPMAPDKPNQDAVAVVRSKDRPSRALFGVFDGHGPFGEHASHFCRMEMMKMLAIAQSQHPKDTPKELLRRTLGYLDRKFAATDHKTTKVDPIVSGTTAIVVMLDGDEVIAANVGDSRAILATRKGDAGMKVVALSEDHKPERPDEKARIERSSAVMLNEHEVRGRPRDRTEANPGKTYICRHANGEIVYGVLFTRSIGDVDAHRHLGISSEPEFRVEKISERVDDDEEQVIILGSDGVWDMMENEEAAEIALSSLDPLEASEKIVKVCAERWANSSEGRRDDITACVVGLGVKFGNNNSRGGGARGERAGSYFGVI